MGPLDFLGKDFGGFFIAYFLIIITVLSIVALLALIRYALTAYALMRIAENHNIENPFLAWVPFANYYILGKLVGRIRLFDREITNMQWVLLAGSFYPIIIAIPLVGWALPIAWIILLASSQRYGV